MFMKKAATANEANTQHSYKRGKKISKHILGIFFNFNRLQIFVGRSCGYIQHITHTSHDYNWIRSLDATKWKYSVIFHLCRFDCMFIYYLLFTCYWLSFTCGSIEKYNWIRNCCCCCCWGMKSYVRDSSNIINILYFSLMLPIRENEMVSRSVVGKITIYTGELSLRVIIFDLFKMPLEMDTWMKKKSRNIV